MDHKQGITPAETNQEDCCQRRTWIFDLIFKDYTWINAANNVQALGVQRPAVALIGHDLIQAYHDSTHPSYLALIVNDWSGDVYFSLRHELFRTFRDQDFDYNKESCEVTFRKSGMVLHVGEVMRSDEWVMMRDPSKLFGLHNGAVQTAVLYFKLEFEDELVIITPRLEEWSTSKGRNMFGTCVVSLCM